MYSSSHLQHNRIRNQVKELNMRKIRQFSYIIIILTLVLAALGTTTLIAQAGNKDPKADPKALLDAAVTDSNKVLAENAPK
jgi:hypothetical protein